MGSTTFIQMFRVRELKKRQRKNKTYKKKKLLWLFEIAAVIKTGSRVEVDKGKSICVGATTRKKRRSETYRACSFPPLPAPLSSGLYGSTEAKPRCHSCEIEVDTIMRSARWRGLTSPCISQANNIV